MQPSLRTAAAVANLTAVFLTHDWRRSQVARALTRAFTPPPEIEIWQWADENVLLQNEDAAEPGEYRSAKTPWTKRLQELIRKPEMWVWKWDSASPPPVTSAPDLQLGAPALTGPAAGRYVRVPVTEINVQKSSQSGYSEACLNGIRWKVSFRPCNVIYAIDSTEESKKIARRLLRSFKFLDPSIFTGDPDDIKSTEFQLRGMELLFYGSYSTGKFANKQAPFTISDEVEEHGKAILDDLASRKKTSTGGLQINLSKPKLKGGPIHRAFERGNQEEFFVPCPHCGHLQFLTFFPEERDVPYSEEFVWVNTETGENFDTDPFSLSRAGATAPQSGLSSGVSSAEHDEFLPVPVLAERESGVVAQFATDGREALQSVAGENTLGGRPPFASSDKPHSPGRQKFIQLPRPLPLGQTRKLKTGRFVFEHCKNLLGRWDRYRIQTETYYECAACQGHIEDHHKRHMLDRGLWFPLELSSSPGIVSQHMSDFYSEDELSTFGKLADEYVEAKHESHERLQGFHNHRGGKVWSDEANKTETADILANRAGNPLWFVDAPNTEGQIVRNIFTDEGSAQRLADASTARGVDAPVIHSACPPYQRGTIPFLLARKQPKAPPIVILGSDVGGNYARWVALGVHSNFRDACVIDWGEELDPDSIRELINSKSWPMRHNPEEKIRCATAWMDARYRPQDVYRACMASGGVIVPTKGLGGAAAVTVKLWTVHYLPLYKNNFWELHYNDQRAKDATYFDRIKKMRRRLWFPVDVADDPDFIEELCAEHQQQDRRGRWYWPDVSAGPNHYGDALKEALLGLDFLTRNRLKAAA